MMIKYSEEFKHEAVRIALTNGLSRGHEGSGAHTRT
jgi:transposase-like protein